MNNMILKVLTGSRAYGLEVEGSDWDFHAVFVTPTADLLRLGQAPKGHTWDESKDKDVQTWEIGRFLFLATKCNPTVLETLVAPVVVSEDPALILSCDMNINPPPPGAFYRLTIGEELKTMFPHVLARKRVYDAFKGYAHNQRAKLFNKPDDPTAAQPTAKVWKFAVQYIRALAQGERLLRTGELVVDMKDRAYGPLRDYLMDLRMCRHSLGNVVDYAQDMEESLEASYFDSEMQEEPDLDAVNDFLLKVRKENW